MEQLLKEAEEIQSYLEIECSNNPEEIEERLSAISVYKARSGEMLAQAKKLYRRKRSSEIANTIINIAKQQFLSATAQNALVESIAEDEAFLVDWLERINAACTMQSDALRSILSYEKENLSLTKKGY
jgi:hypothetical protein